MPKKKVVPTPSYDPSMLRNAIDQEWPEDPTEARSHAFMLANLTTEQYKHAESLIEEATNAKALFDEADAIVNQIFGNIKKPKVVKPEQPTLTPDNP